MGPLTGDEWDRAAARRGGADRVDPRGGGRRRGGGGDRRGSPLPVHLKLDTGMGRLGARPEDVDALVEAAAAAGPGVRVAGLMTHFATADETEGENAGFMAEQLVRFRGRLPALRRRFPDAVVHAANSAATLRDPAAAFDMVRCGIALYGCSPFMGDPDDDDLRPAMSLVSYLGSVKTLRSRESVGYGRVWRAARGTRVGLVPVGYADGYARVALRARRRCWWAAAGCRWSARSRWTSSPWTSARRHRGRGGRGGAASASRAASGSPPRRSPPGAARSTTR